MDGPMERWGRERSEAGESLGPTILTVSELTARIKGMLGELGRISVEGEVASVRTPASGHIYFNLKDRLRGVESVVGCAIWRSQVARATRQPLTEGEQVIAHGRIDVYGPRGSYSLIVDRIEPKGLGALLVQLEELKRELVSKGWFDRARPLPRLPRVIGVATSRDGAAFQDFLRTRTLRWPLYPVRLAHTAVQGAGAAGEIAQAITALDRSGVDVIVVCRGGGSLEDLWAFNERAVAEAIHAASVPVVSGVGHQTDSTLADSVADFRAHTPTDAAQSVIPPRAELEEELERGFNYLLSAIDEVIAAREQRLRQLREARVLRSADWILERRTDALGRAGARLDRGVHLAVERAGRALEGLACRLPVRVREALQRTASRVELFERQLQAFSPFAVLRRGYSITTVEGEEGGAPLTESGAVAPGALLRTRLASGEVSSRVEAVREAEEEGE